jgi:hypothetical protein
VIEGLVTSCCPSNTELNLGELGVEDQSGDIESSTSRCILYLFAPTPLSKLRQFKTCDCA